MSKRIIEIEIGCCGDCPYYDYKKHRCSKGAMDEGEPTDNFYADCPLNYREKRTNNKQIEGKVFTDVDILANDLNQHCADLAETYCGDTNCLTCLAHALTSKGYRKASEVVENIFGEIFALCDNAEEKLDILFTKANDYRKGYENSVKHFRSNMEMLKKKYESEDTE